MAFQAWLVFIGSLVKIGLLLITYFVSIFNIQTAANLYLGLELSAYMDYSFIHYSFIAGYRVILLLVQTYVAYLMIRFLDRTNLNNPFNSETVKLLKKVSFSIIGLWIVVIVHNSHLKFLEVTTGLNTTYLASGFITLSAIVYILAQMFKRGIEIQTENNLTI